MYKAPVLAGGLAKKIRILDYGRPHEWVVEIPFLYPSENQILAMHPMERRRKHDKFQANAGAFLAAAHIKPFTGPVKIFIDLYFKKKRRRDNDNYGGKWLIDTIVKVGILPDDSKEWIPAAPDILLLDGEPEDKTMLKIMEVI